MLIRFLEGLLFVLAVGILVPKADAQLRSMKTEASVSGGPCLSQGASFNHLEGRGSPWIGESGDILSNRCSDNSLSLADSAEAAQARYPFESDSFHWPSFLGGDLFATADVYAPPLNVTHNAIAIAGGLGVEIRIHPVFFGYIGGGSADALGDFGGGFQYQSVYGGISLNAWRFDLGGTSVGDYLSNHSEPGYIVAFLDVSRRYGGIIFIEPEMRIVFPVAGTLVHVVNTGYAPPQYYYATQHFRLSDLFIGLSVKLGIGYN